MQSIHTQKNTTKGVTHLLNSEQVAEILGVKPDTLCYWRCTGRYALPYVKVGRLVMYRAEDINEFIENRTIEWEDEE
jgi:predicted site-specific integrase-resolvase